MPFAGRSHESTLRIPPMTGLICNFIVGPKIEINSMAVYIFTKRTLTGALT